ncbi:tRNA wybutosine-synthesizing protein 5 isoform X3 [Cynara cardunculus var. scolymus]|uniref:tRNA wybutosine-synthesizing protein 5 isoform X3 n=1 Tax=Cynara cardunculus var. scolymus TaxID=59895 RepID=UPI000D62520C|nr:tRNA wybutosine-synthesizing protein 5 isoform X3 [Cynara cardunculus var. scolymus]
MEEESPRIAIIDAIPSAEEFISQIEPKNVPVVFHGCVNDWKAFSKWNPSNGGLDYLQGLAGSSTVEVMLSKSAPVFYGNIGNHERVQLPLSTFIGYCKDVFLQSTEGHALCSSTEMLLPANFETGQDDPLVGDIRQIYLAQVPIMNVEKEERVQLESLIKDIQTPLFLETKTLASINLWMNGAQARSSTHYDPHHNLLCVVSGSKQVNLWPPSSSPFLYPMPLHGEASNHSAVPMDEPDISLHPRAEHSKKYVQRVILHAGDALFIPEGWFHQVDSESLTIAVNLWWRSEMMSGMSEHMDSYYLRRILKRIGCWERLSLVRVTSVLMNNQHHFPRTLEALVLHLISPVGAEVLTRKFDEMDQVTNEEERNEFYRAFYGVFDDQFAVMDALLNGKESFSCQAFKNVMDRFLGVKVQ